MSDTPETDALRFPKALNAFEAVEFLMEFARKMERERDEARRIAKEAQFSEWPPATPLPWER